MNFNYVFFTEAFKGLDRLFFLDIEDYNNVKIVRRRDIFKNKIMKNLLIVHFSHRINKIIKIPFKFLWYKNLFKDDFENKKSICFIFSPDWYYPEYIKYLKENYKNAKFVIYFSDTIESKIKNIPTINIKKIKSDFDLVLSYNPEDVKKYDLTYSSIYYSKINQEILDLLPNYHGIDVLFIGAERNRLDKIEKLYEKLKKMGLDCYFYVVTKNKDKLKNNSGIIFTEKIMSFDEYLARTISSKYILEIVDENTTGCTLRFWEAIMYNKKLISNFKNLKNTKFYSEEKMLYFEDIDKINEEFFKSKKSIKYNYQNENSPVNFLKIIKERLEEVRK